MGCMGISGAESVRSKVLKVVEMKTENTGGAKSLW